MRAQQLIVAFTISAGAACTTTTPPFVDGNAPFLYEGETFQTYWKLFGNLNSGHTPLVVLHGGPGLSHEYLVPFADLTAQNDTPIILYDQLGNAKSTHFDNKPSSFDRLEFLDATTLLINGRADIVQDFVIAPYFQKFSKVKWITFELSSHMPFWEEREKYFDIVSDFLAP